LTEGFVAERGLRQGDALSTAVFSIVLGKVIRNTETNLKGTMSDRTRQYTAYAGDVLILVRSVTETE